MLSGREQDGDGDGRSISSIRGSKPHERLSSRAYLGLKTGVGQAETPLGHREKHHAPVRG
jgi:hypothetical protein